MRSPTGIPKKSLGVLSSVPGAVFRCCNKIGRKLLVRHCSRTRSMPSMPEGSCGNVGIRSAAADAAVGKDDATVEGAAGPTEKPTAEPCVVVDEDEALLRNYLAVNRKRQHNDMKRQADLHRLDMGERLNAQKTTHDAVLLAAQTTIEQQNVEISTHLGRISQQNKDIETHLATIATHVKTQQQCHDEQKRLEQENTSLRDKMQNTQNLCAQLNVLMFPEQSLQHAQQGSLPTSCRQEARA